MDELTKWRVEKIQQFEWIHQESLHFCFFLRGSAWKEVGLHESEIDQRAHFYNWFYDGFENTENYPLRDDEFYKQRLELRVDNPHYGILIASQCLIGAIWVKNMKKDTVDFRENIEFFRDYQLRGYGIYVGYWLAILDARKKKSTSGKGQKMAMEKRLKAIGDQLRPLIKGDGIRVDYGKFHKLVSSTFIGAEHYPRDRKTMKSYQNALEERLACKIVVEKGTIIPE